MNTKNISLSFLFKFYKFCFIFASSLEEGDTARVRIILWNRLKANQKTKEGGSVYFQK